MSRDNKLFFLQIILIMLSPIPSLALTSTDSLEILITPDHNSWKYEIGENVHFGISIINNSRSLTDEAVHIVIGPEKMDATIDTIMIIPESGLKINAGTLRQPGFLRCTVTLSRNGKSYRELVTVGFEPNLIKPTTSKPDDFDSFWTQAMEKSAKIPMDPRLTLLKEKSTALVNVYEVNLQSYLPGNRLFGILSVPKKKGTYPAVLKLPGAGVRSYSGEIELAEKGLITFEIGIHGIPQDLDKDVYYDLAFGALRNYYFQNLDNRDTYYYKRVFMGCIRAVDFIYSLPEFNGSDLATYGGSQGGALSIVTAALDKRVKFLVSLFPAMSDLTGYLHGRAGGWPHLFNKENAPYNLTKTKIKNSQYYDMVNFAKSIDVPGLYSWGYNDEVCPPTTSYAVYNVIKSTKTLKIFKKQGHWESKEQRQLLENWLQSRLIQ